MTDRVRRISAKDLVDAKAPRGLKALLEELRTDGNCLTFEAIAGRIDTYYGVSVSGEAVRQWCKDEGVD